MRFDPTLPDAIGFIGSLTIVTLYLLTLRGTMRTSGLLYPSLNLVGCALIMVSLAYNPNLPSLFIEVFWSVVSLYGIARHLLGRTG